MPRPQGSLRTGVMVAADQRQPVGSQLQFPPGQRPTVSIQADGDCSCGAEWLHCSWGCQAFLGDLHPILGQTVQPAYQALIGIPEAGQ